MLLLDEPLGALDPLVRAELQDGPARDLRRRRQDGGPRHPRPRRGGASSPTASCSCATGGSSQEGTLRTSSSTRRPTPFVDRASSSAQRRLARERRSSLAARRARGATPAPRSRVGSKAFTESVILGEIATQLLAPAGVAGEHRRELGGTAVALGGAARRRDRRLPRVHRHDRARRSSRGARGRDLRAALAQRGRRPSARRSASTTPTRSACGRRGAARLGIAQHLRPGARTPSCASASPTSSWTAPTAGRRCAPRYGLPQTDVRGLDHDARLPRARRAARSTSPTSTRPTPRSPHYGLRVLERRSRATSRATQAVLLYRARPRRRAPARRALARARRRASTAPTMIAHERARASATSVARGARRRRVPAHARSGVAASARRRAGTRCARSCAARASTSILVALVARCAAIARRASRSASSPRAGRALGQVDPRRRRRRADHPVAGAARVHDPAPRHRQRAGDRGAVPLQLLPIVRNTHAGLDRHPRRRCASRRRRSGCRRGARLRLRRAAAGVAGRSSPASRPRR